MTHNINDTALSTKSVSDVRFKRVLGVLQVKSFRVQMDPRRLVWMIDAMPDLEMVSEQATSSDVPAFPIEIPEYCPK